MTHLSLDDVVALNALIVTAIGLTFALGRNRKPAPLNLVGPKRKTALDEMPADSRAVAVRSNSHNAGAGRGPGNSSPARGPGNSYGAAALQRLEEQEMRHQAQGSPVSLVTPPAPSRQLNVFFNWNGHTWDAYEVLGVPAGASRDTVVQAFHHCRAKSPDSIAFLQAATDAILKR